VQVLLNRENARFFGVQVPLCIQDITLSYRPRPGGTGREGAFVRYILGQKTCSSYCRHDTEYQALPTLIWIRLRALGFDYKRLGIGPAGEVLIGRPETLGRGSKVVITGGNEEGIRQTAYTTKRNNIGTSKFEKITS
jgi:hypothetical protein